MHYEGTGSSCGCKDTDDGSILSWYREQTGKEYFLEDGNFGKDIDETAIPQKVGITTVESLTNFYMR